MLLVVGVGALVYTVTNTQSRADYFQKERDERFAFHQKYITEYAKPNYPKAPILVVANHENEELASANDTMASLWKDLGQLAIWQGVCYLVICILNIIIIVVPSKEVSTGEVSAL
jgi:hypothetical protein